MYLPVVYVCVNQAQISGGLFLFWTLFKQYELQQYKIEDEWNWRSSTDLINSLNRYMKKSFDENQSIVFLR